MNLDDDRDLEARLARLRPVAPPPLSLAEAATPARWHVRLALAASIAGLVVVLGYALARRPVPEPAPLAAARDREDSPPAAPEEPARRRDRPDYARFRAAASSGPEALDRFLTRVSGGFATAAPTPSALSREAH